MGQLQHKERLLRKVKMNNNGGATVDWLDTFYDPESGSYVKNEESRTSDGAVHQDFTDAFKPLVEHLAVACEMVPEVKANHSFDGSLKGIEKFAVSSLTLRGGLMGDDGDRDPVYTFIFGRKRLKDGRVVNFGTPNIKLGSPQEPYKHVSMLDMHIQQVEKEAWAYLDGKVAPPAQKALPFEEGGDTGDADDVGEEEGAKLLGEAK